MDLHVFLFRDVKKTSLNEENGLYVDKYKTSPHCDIPNKEKASSFQSLKTKKNPGQFKKFCHRQDYKEASCST